MRIVAVYNMKGGVGKTTTAVNLSYFAATAGLKTLLWDLDPQAASSFAFRVRPHVSGFGRQSLEDGQALGAAIKETDYDNLHLLPADFAYRKFERFLGSIGKPERLLPSLLDTLGRDFDVVFLDCPAGFSLLTEGIIASADVVLVPTIPTVLSLRTVARLIMWAERTHSPSRLAMFFSMVDRRKTMHRRSCEWSVNHPETFLSGNIPYASIVEQMAIRRMPLPVFAPRDSATGAFAQIWSELQAYLRPVEDRLDQRDQWIQILPAIEALITRLDLGDREVPSAAEPQAGDVCFVHSFDTQGRDLARSGHVLELRELHGRLLVVAAQSGRDAVDVTRQAQAQIDRSWAVQILAGEMSPLDALERRLGRPGPRTVQDIRAMVLGGRLQRVVDTRQSHPTP